MPSQPSTKHETINASIQKSRQHLQQLQNDMHSTVLMSRHTVLQSRELITKVDEILVQTRFMKAAKET